MGDNSGRKRKRVSWSRLAVVSALAIGVAYLVAASPPGVTSAAHADVPLSAAPVIGNPLGRVTIVEFFDYRCPYCRIMQPRLQALLADRHDVRLVLKEWPVFGGVSVYAAKVALASAWQGKFEPVHDALFALPLPFDEAAVRAAAQKAGVDMTRLDHDLSTRGSEIDTELTANAVEAQKLGFPGTPGFVIGHETVPGALSRRDLDRLISQARSAEGTP